MPKYITLLFRGHPLECEKLNSSTQYAQELLRKYSKSKKASIRDAYAKPSADKEKAFNEILEEMASVDGGGMRITGAMSYHFSCAYLATDDSHRKWLIYNTRTNRFAIPVV